MTFYIRLINHFVISLNSKIDEKMVERRPPKSKTTTSHFSWWGCFFFLNFWAKQFHYLFIYSFIINNNFLYWFVITWFTTIIYLPFFLTPVASPVSVPDEQRLFEDLMMGYEKSVRPVINANTILKVTFSLKLNQIIDLVSSVSQTSLVKKEIQIWIFALDSMKYGMI